MIKSDKKTGPMGRIEIDPHLSDILFVSRYGKSFQSFFYKLRDEYSNQLCGYSVRSAIVAYRQALKKHDQQTKRAEE